MENGEYLRSSEIDEEANYNMIDGINNNGRKKNGWASVLAKLRMKQAEIAKRSGKESLHSRWKYQKKWSADGSEKEREKHLANHGQCFSFLLCVRKSC